MKADYSNTTTDQNGQTYIYDAWNRLAIVNTGSDTITYGYDAMGRRITETDGNTGITTDLCNSDDSSNSTVGVALGRFNSGGSPDLSFGTSSVAGISMSVESAISSPIVDSEGNVLEWGICTASGSGNYEKIKIIRLTPNGTLDTSFGSSGIETGAQGTHVLGDVLQPSGNLVVATFYFGVGQLFMERFNTAAPATRLYVEQDADYNVTSLTDNSGNVVERYSYDAYGAVTVLNPDGTVRGDGSAASSLYGWVYLHQGLRLDGATALYDDRNRVYDPSMGRFLQEDPAGVAGSSTNLYQFVSSSPLNWLDPTGDDKVPPPKPAPVVIPAGANGAVLAQLQAQANDGLGAAVANPNAHPTPGKEKTVIIFGDLGFWPNRAFTCVYNSYLNHAYNNNENVETHYSGVTPGELGDILRDPDVVKLIIIAHGASPDPDKPNAPQDGPGAIEISPGTWIYASDVKAVIGKSTHIKDVTLRACNQGKPIAGASWAAAFNILQSNLRAPRGADHNWSGDPDPVAGK